jgi:hypothetical protein
MKKDRDFCSEFNEPTAVLTATSRRKADVLSVEPEVGGQWQKSKQERNKWFEK